MDPKQKIQHHEYDFPYHYLPQIEGEYFKALRKWNWSLQYISALIMVRDRLAQISPKTHIDVGCGDGGLLYHLKGMFPEVEFSGIDYDAKAITLANIMSPDINFEHRNLLTDPIDRQYDSASLIEVLEHIPPQNAGDFVASVRKALPPGSSLLLTVPHENKKLIPKHYRHFSFNSLLECVEPHFEVKEMFAFEKRTFASKLQLKLLKMKGATIEIDWLNRYALNEQLNLTSKEEGGFHRIFAHLVAKNGGS